MVRPFSTNTLIKISIKPYWRENRTSAVRSLKILLLQFQLVCFPELRSDHMLHRVCDDMAHGILAPRQIMRAFDNDQYSGYPQQREVCNLF